MKNFRLELREHATKIINYEKKKMIPLTKEEKKSNRTSYTIYAKKSLVLMITIKIIIKLEIIVTLLRNIEVLLMISAT